MSEAHAGIRSSLRCESGNAAAKGAASGDVGSAAITFSIIFVAASLSPLLTATAASMQKTRRTTHTAIRMNQPTIRQEVAIPITSPINNVMAISVNGGPTNNSLNQPFASVTICVPGTSNCQIIGGLLIDTGSVGLRILASAVTIPLPAQAGAGGAPIGECLAFIDGSVVWGPVRTADVRLAGEQASSAPIQLIGGDGFGSVPSGCSSQGTPQLTQSDFGSNGVLGIGMFRQDCPPDCKPNRSAWNSK